MFLRRVFAIYLAFWLSLFADAQSIVVKGRGSIKGTVSVALGVTQFFAALPINWANAGLTTGTGFCPTSGFAATKTMPGDYAATFAGLIQAKTDQVTANAHWLLKIAAGTNIHGSSFDSNGALATLPNQVNGHTTCLVIQSSVHNTDSVIVCSLGLPLPGQGNRNSGCSNSIANMWRMTIDSSPTAGFRGLLLQPGDAYTVIEDAELTIAPGAFQSASVVKNVIQLDLSCNFCGVAYSYIHGWNPGDSGQPGAGSGNPAVDNTTGVCLAWNRSGTLTADGSTTLTWASGDRFGMDFSDGTHSANYPQVISGQSNQLNITGIGSRTIVSHVPESSDTAFIVNSSVAAGTYAFTLQNPRTGWGTGCGDDSRSIQVNCNKCFVEFNYFEKIHWWGNESHAISSGFSNGPVKIAHNWIEAGTGGVFLGGAPVDTRGGPVYDYELRGNFIGRDLTTRFLSASAGHSPGPPFGCGPLDAVAGHNTCPFSWTVKNNIELKVGARVLIDGNIIDGNWADGQDGSIVLLNVRSCSGGQACGIYDPSTGLPQTLITNVRISNNWIRNSPQGISISPRSLGPGNGGGMSVATKGLDILGNLWTNMRDGAQFGTPGNDLVQWGGGGANTYLCTMSRTSGVAHAACSPIGLGNLVAAQYPSQPTLLANEINITSLVRTSSTVVMKFGNRLDPTVGSSAVLDVQDWLPTTRFTNTQIKPSSGNPSGTIFSTGVNAAGTATGSVAPNWATCTTTCADGTITWTNTGTTSVGVEGTFSIGGVQNNGVSTTCTTDINGNTVAANAAVGGPGTTPLNLVACVRADGTFGDTITYTDARGDLSLCTSQSTCSQKGLRLTLPTLAYKIADLGVGDNVLTTNCTDSSYLTGTTSVSPAVSPTSAAGLDVYYANAGLDDSSGSTCQLQNNSGNPANASFQSNTVLATSIMDISAGSQSKQFPNNWFLHNIFAMPSGNGAVLTCTPIGGQGTAVYVCWDATTFQFFDNVMQGRTSGQWSVVPLTATANAFPTNVACSGATADGTCLGYSGFMSGNAFPTSSCTYDGSNPNNCRLMALPWSTNFDLTQLAPATGAVYTNEGVNLTTLQNAFTATQYSCPEGANCGSGTSPD